MGRMRRSAVALWAALTVVALGVVTVEPHVLPTSSQASGAASTDTSTSDEPTVVDGRYLIRTGAQAADTAQLTALVEQTGATVLKTYDTLWSGVSVAATDSQLAQIEDALGTDAVFPVYRLHLSDPTAFSTDDDPDPTADPTGSTTPETTAPARDPSATSCTPDPDSTPTPTPDPTDDTTTGATDEPSADPTETSTTDPTVDPTDDPTTDPTDAPTGTPTPVPPLAVDDSATTLQNQPVTISPLANDVAGADGGDPATAIPLVPDSLVLTGSGASEDGKTLDTAAGAWTVGADATVTFTPGASFTGEATADYEVSDTADTTVSATITVTVTAVVPTATADCAAVPARHTATVDVLANDAPGDPSAPLQATSVRFTADGATDGGRALSTSEGEWLADSSGTVTFTPADDFDGATARTTYEVSDANGTTSHATVSVTVGTLTTATDTTGTTPQNVTLTTAPLDGVTIGDDGTGTPGTLVLSSMVFTDTAHTLDSGRTLVVQNEGTWRIDEATGAVSFDPESAFVGTAQAAWAITDSFGNTASATITVTVTAVTPVAGEDDQHTAANNPVTFDVLANDQRGADSAPLNPSTLKLLPAASTSEGTWTLNSDHTVTFTPAEDFTGIATRQYEVRDANMTPAPGVIRVVVGALPQGVSDATTASQDGTTLTLTPLSNDVAGDDGRGDDGRGTFVGSTVELTSGGATDGGKKLATDSYTWAVADDGTVTFTPDWRWTGSATTDYRVTDSFGNPTSATISVTITASAPTTTETRLTSIGALGSSDRGTGIKVGIIDSGVDYDHPDLGGTTGGAFPTTRVTTGYDFVDNDTTPMDCYGHGTKVAGIVGADGNPKVGGAYGVAPGVTFGAYRVFDCNGSATTDDIIAALERAASDGMNVVNLSLGASSASWPDDPLGVAAANLVKKGVVVVAASGNSGDKGLFTASSPAVAPGVISLAAANAGSTGIEGYSAMGLAADLSLTPTLTAPGSSVHTTAMDDAYSDPTGTSMASPEVAGAVAQILQAKGWTAATAGVPAKVAALLYGSASPLDTTTASVKGRPEAVFRQGAGLVQVDAALTATVTASPSVLKLGEGTTHKTSVTLSNSGSSAVTYKIAAVTGASAAASTGSRTNVGTQTPDWAYAAVGFSASPSSVTVPAGGTAKVTVTITPSSKVLKGRNGLLYGGWVRFTATDAQTVSVPFAGVRGDYQKVKLLPSGKRGFTDSSTNLPYTVQMPALAFQNSAGAIQGTYSGTRTFHVAKSGGQPYVMFHLDYPASAIRVKAINQKTKKSYYAVLSGTSTQFGKRGRDESYSVIPFYGAYKNSAGKVVGVPAGTYKLQLRVLAPLGSSSKTSHWQTYTTRAFKVTWS
ncbi:MAG: S8 family serine peptidase [Propionicimonas sp.]|uniref:S8 family serine peptidase n=1 Tax=Propionicimonas sp. TaxID=1955623 RepID=UPI003D0CD2A0